MVEGVWVRGHASSRFLLAQNCLSRNGLIEPIEQQLFRENSSVMSKILLTDLDLNVFSC